MDFMFRHGAFLCAAAALLGCAEKPAPTPPVVPAPPPPPVVEGLSPAQGYAGDLVALSGKDLAPLDKVTFEGKAAEVVEAGADRVVVRVPDDLPEESTVRLASGRGASEAAARFRFLGVGAISRQVVSDVIPLATRPRRLTLAGGLIFAQSESYGILLNSGVAVPHWEGKLVEPLDLAAPEDESALFALVADGSSAALLAIDVSAEDLPVSILARRLPASARLATDGNAVFLAETLCAECALWGLSAGTGAVLWKTPLAGGARALAAAGGRLVVGLDDSLETYTLDAGTAAPTYRGSLEAPGGVWRLDISPEGRAVVLDFEDRVWWYLLDAQMPWDGDGSTANGISPTLTHLTNSWSLACGSGCDEAFVTFPLENRVLVVGRLSRRVVGAASIPGAPTEIVSGPSSIYVTTQANSRAAQIDTATRTLVDDQIYLNTGLRSAVIEDAQGTLMAYAIYLDSLIRLSASGRKVLSVAPLSAAVDIECLDLDILDEIPPLVSPGDGRLVVWRGRRVEVLRGTTKFEIDAGACIRRMVVAGGSERLFLETGEGVKTFDLGTGALEGLVSFPGAVDVIAATPWGAVIGTRLEAAGSTVAEVYAMDASGLAQPMGLAGKLARATLLAPVRGGTRFVAVGIGEDSEKYLYGLDKSGGFLKRVRAGGAAGDLGPLLVSPSGRRIYSMSSADTSTRLVSAPIASEPCCSVAGVVTAIDLPATSPVGFAQSPAGDRLYVLDEDRDRLIVVE